MAPQELAALYQQLKQEFQSSRPDLKKTGALLAKLKVPFPPSFDLKQHPNIRVSSLL
jgi:hypothetical protein